jgi:uncharacterized protein YdaU (DUF1376 family)
MPRDERPPSFQFYGRDFRADANVEAMSFDQRGRYVWALCASWDTDAPGIATEEQWRRWMCYSPAQWGRHREVMASAFKIRDDGMWVQSRMQREREAQVHRFQKASESGRKGAENRWGGHA